MPQGGAVGRWLSIPVLFTLLAAVRDYCTLYSSQRSGRVMPVGLAMLRNRGVRPDREYQNNAGKRVGFVGGLFSSFGYPPA